MQTNMNVMKGMMTAVLQMWMPLPAGNVSGTSYGTVALSASSCDEAILVRMVDSYATHNQSSIISQGQA